MSSYTEKIVRMRRQEDDDKEIIPGNVEEGEYSSEGEESAGDGSKKSHHKRKSSSRKHRKHHKKEKKKKKRRRRSPSGGSPSRKRSRKSSPEDTDVEGASTPEIIDVDAIEDGEISSRESPEPPPSSSPPRRSRQKSEERVVKRRASPHSAEHSSSRHRRTIPRSDSPRGEESLSNGSADARHKRRPPPREEEPPSSSSSNGGRQKATAGPEEKDSLSIEETNKLREKLGLKPLRVDKEPPPNIENAPSEFSQYEVIPSSLKNERHRPPQNLGEISRTEKIRKKLQERREKRAQESKLLLVRGLGDATDDEGEGAAGWVKKQEKTQREKEAAAKRAKVLDELDEDFGVGAILEEEDRKKKAYQTKDLKGLRVEHSLEGFSEGQSVILTLKDADVLDEEGGDALVNVNMVDDERAKKKVEDAKKAKSGYNPYDQEMVDEDTGELRRKNLLDKYDEEIDGEIKKSFSIGSEGVSSSSKEKERIRERLNKNLVSLALPEKKVASDYYTPGEVVAFKKSKKSTKKSSKKSTKRRMLKADDLINMMNVEPGESFGSRRGPKEIEDEDIGEIRDLSKVDICEEEKQVELSQAEKLRLKIKEKLKRKAKEDIGDLLLREAPVREEEMITSSGAELIGTFADDEINSKNIILNETSEFCRNLGAWTSNYGSYEGKETSGGGGGSSSVLEEFEDSLKSNSTKSREERWKDDDMSCGDDDDDTDVEEGSSKQKKNKSSVESVTILDEEPNLNVGVGSAIQMAVNKGYWESELKTNSGSNLKHLMSQNYFIEDKVQGNDDRSSRRQDRYGSGPTVAFQEKKDYSPKINLEYIDDSGRKLNSKEAFRYLSHRFHGKGSGKLKTEKRMKKSAEESMMRNMSSTDTPLGTVEKMLKKQKETSTPYLVISGKNQHPELRK